MTQTQANVNQSRTRLGNKSGRYKRQLYGDSGAHQLISCRSLNNHCSTAFNHCQQQAKNGPLIQLQPWAGEGHSDMWLHWGQNDILQILLDHGPRLVLHISSAYSHLVFRSILNLNVSFKFEFGLFGVQSPKTKPQALIDNLLKPSQNFSNNLNQR